MKEQNISLSEIMDLKTDRGVFSNICKTMNIPEASIEESEMRSAGFGMTYDGCCWAAKIAFPSRHRPTKPTPSRPPDR